jgi:hypothetical protein
MVKEKIYSVLSSILPTYQFTIPETNETFPVCRYYIVNQTDAFIGDGRGYGRDIDFTVTVYQTKENDKLINQIEQSIKSAFGHCFLEVMRERKEDGLFLIEFDFRIIRGK